MAVATGGPSRWVLWRDCAIAAEPVMVSSSVNKAIVDLCIASRPRSFGSIRSPLREPRRTPAASSDRLVGAAKCPTRRPSRTWACRGSHSVFPFRIKDAWGRNAASRRNPVIGCPAIKLVLNVRQCARVGIRKSMRLAHRTFVIGSTRETSSKRADRPGRPATRGVADAS